MIFFFLVLLARVVLGIGCVWFGLVKISLTLQLRWTGSLCHFSVILKTLSLRLSGLTLRSAKNYKCETKPIRNTYLNRRS